MWVMHPDPSVQTPDYFEVAGTPLVLHAASDAGTVQVHRRVGDSSVFVPLVVNGARVEVGGRESMVVIPWPGIYRLVGDAVPVFAENAPLGWRWRQEVSA